MTDPSALRWGHININVSSLEASIRFYELLGFSVFLPGIPYIGIRREKPGKLSAGEAAALGMPEDIRARACIMQLGDSYPKLDLMEIEHSSQAREPLTSADRGLVRFCLGTTDLMAEYERLTNAGVSFLTPPENCDNDMASIALCTDPDGTLIELIELNRRRWEQDQQA